MAKKKKLKKGKRKKKKTAPSQTKTETQTSRLSLLARRSVFLNGPLTEELANGVVEEICDLLEKNSEEPIYLCINTSGGDEPAAHGLRNFLKNFLRIEKLVTVLLGPADLVASILFMSAEERVMAKDLVLDIAPSQAIGFVGENGASNGTQKPNEHPLATLIHARGPISATQALEEGIATGLI